ncbi:precorrin-8X methylmutase [Allobranchiibius sp. GilTou73]|uniref:precorrin-8X methylmutase n=1 Tax=Allobranchiibius sp. GilTou73 TaxID=2904523 RepID=UPI001F36EF7E|nr:precorrin-8X methylmutase [Allobranchiibius sp. GilTou73]UIJ35194.1 precorrin-8X methylmutase [Allobranchiibius sp. GilTou73]
MNADPSPPTRRYDYVADGAEIYRRSFGMVREQADLSAVPADLRVVVTRIVHACGDVDIVPAVAASSDVVTAARHALRSGAAVFTDSVMLASGVTARRMPAHNEVLCTLRDARVPALAKQWHTTRAAAAVSLWDERLDGAVVAIGNAPTALFHLLEVVMDGGPRPAAIVGMPVGFIGSAESKVALAEHELPDGGKIPWITVHGHRGGSAMASAAVNALATESELA